MKKIITILAILCLTLGMVFCFTACNNNKTITVDACWANHETLSYAIYDSEVNSGTTSVGNLNIQLNALLTDNEKSLNYNEELRSYPDANVLVEETLTRTVGANIQIHTTILAHHYTVYALNKEYTDLDDNTKSYTLQSYHDGKNYVYTLTYATGETKEGKIKVGSSSYTDNEFLYYYIRCYNVDSVPSSVTVADAKNDRAIELKTTFVETETVITGDEKIGAVVCNKISVTKKESPVGNSIYLWCLPDSDVYSYGDFDHKSKKFPVKINENNITYTLISHSASYTK